MKKSFLLIAILLPVVLAGNFSMAGERPLSTIYPGQGIGYVSLGEKLSNFIEILGWGKPEEFRKDDQKKEYYLIYEKRGMVFTFKEGKKLSEATLDKITVRNPTFMVAGIGIRVGDRRADIYTYAKKAFWGALQQQSYKGINIDQCEDDSRENKENRINIVCGREGIRFIVNRTTDIIEAIEIFQPQR